MKKLLLQTLILLITVGSTIGHLPAIAQSDNKKLRPGTSWQWQLEGPIDTSFSVGMYDIDLFQAETHIVDTLHTKGIVVICYFSAGSWERYRTDSALFPRAIKGKVMDGWPDEKWLDIRRIDLLSSIVTARLDLAVKKGCDGVEPDNIDGYDNDTGFPLKYKDQIRYNLWLVKEAHARNLSIGLKNDLGQVEDLVSHFDWALNEQCFEYNECAPLKAFVKAEKAVFGVEYNIDPKSFCPKANQMNFDWLYKDLNLSAKRFSCR